MTSALTVQVTEPDSFEATLRVYEMTISMARHQDQRRTMLFAAFAISNGLFGAVLLGGAVSPGSRAFQFLCLSGVLSNLLWAAVFFVNDRELRRVEGMARVLQNDLAMEAEWRLIPARRARVGMEWLVGGMLLLATVLWVLPLFFGSRV